MTRRFSALVATAVLAMPAATLSAQNPTQQVFIDFAEYASPNATTYQATFGAPLTSKGFDFYQAFGADGNPGGRNVLATWGTNDVTTTNRPSNIGSSTTLFADNPGVEIDIYRAGADPLGSLASLSTYTFNLYSIDVAHLFSTPFVPTLQAFNLVFFGVTYQGATVQQTFTIPVPPTVGGTQTPALNRLAFSPAFTNVVNVYWFQNGVALSQQHQFTNIQAQATTIPEPGTWMLLGTGLAGVLVVARRRRQSA